MAWNYKRSTLEQFREPEMVFEHELRKIRNPTVKTAVTKMLKVAPDEFWVAPSAYSGLYHSPDEFGCGGQVLHTKRVFRALMVLVDAAYERFEEFENPAYLRDVVLAAALIHDTLAGSTGSSDHVSTLVDYYSEHIDLDGRDPVKQTAMDIAELAESHMGRWSPYPELVPDTWVRWLLHYADMIATKFNGLDILKEHDYDIRP